MNLKYLSEYRDKEICQRLLDEIYKIHKKEIRIMEVCGTHTMSISKNGIRQILPQTITLLSGPGCPVCVTAQRDIDKFIKIAQIENVIVTTFGDLLRVPGSYSTLQNERAAGADVRVVYSTLDCLQIAQNHPEKEVVFLGVGFETTAPTIAATVLNAAQKDVQNFSVISAHKLVPPALEALLTSKHVNVDGFMCPGHVSVIIGAQAYTPIVEKYHVPCVIAGFEPVDILQAIYLIIRQIEQKDVQVEVAYKRVVSTEGNKKARDVMYQVFEPENAHWRGIGMIPNSGLAFRNKYQAFNAENRFDVKVKNIQEPKGCICGEILTGIKTPIDCPLFGKKCIPEHPVGACMVSSEGTCAAYYKYHDVK